MNDVITVSRADYELRTMNVAILMLVGAVVGAALVICLSNWLKPPADERRVSS